MGIAFYVMVPGTQPMMGRLVALLMTEARLR